jgi:required for meiotic nuclear division protein 1
MDTVRPLSGRFDGQREIRVRSLHVGGEIDTRGLRKANALAVSPLVLEAGGQGCAVVFRYGAVVLFHVGPEEEKAFLEGLRPHLSRPLPGPKVEEITLVSSSDNKEGVEGERIHVPGFSLPVIQVVAEVLARSVVLESHETQVGATFEALRPIAESLGRGSLTRAHYRMLLKRLGDVLLDQQEMAGRVAVTEKPDVLWDHPEIERLYARLTDEFEIPDRFEAVESKLNLIGGTARTAIDLVQARRNLRFEWYIVVLIVFEICLTLYEMIF